MDCMQYTLCNMACAQYELSALITTLIAQSHDSGTSSISPQSLKQTPIGHYRSHMHAHVHVPGPLFTGVGAQHEWARLGRPW